MSYKVNEELEHKCLHTMCKHCLEYVKIYEHRCFITSEAEKCFKWNLRQLRQEKKTKEKLPAMVVGGDGLKDDCLEVIIEDMVVRRKKKVQELKDINKGIPMEEIKRRRNEEALNDLRERVMLQLVQEGMELDEITLDMVEERVNATQEKQVQGVSAPEQVMVFADVECILDSTNMFVPILICFAREDDDTIFHHWGNNCVQAFIKTMIGWSNQDNKEELHIFFHNLRGFDGIFILDALWNMKLKVTYIMGTGTKTLHFKHKSLVFKDSLCFLNMSLTNFTNTFGLEELKKGWFPHKFSKLENLNYEGTIPALHYYEPQHMDAKKKSL